MTKKFYIVRIIHLFIYDIINKFSIFIFNFFLNISIIKTKKKIIIFLEINICQ